MPQSPIHEFSPPDTESLEMEGNTARRLGGVILQALNGSLIDLDYFEPGRPKNCHARVDGRNHLLRVTEAAMLAADGDRHTIVLLPGFTEMVDMASGSSLHDTVATTNPSSRIVSIATDGIGANNLLYNPIDALFNNFDSMAARRLKIAKAFSHDRSSTIAGASMGSIIALKMVLQNLDEKDADKKIDLKHSVYLSHGQVPPRRIANKVFSFPGHAVINGWQEGFRNMNAAFEHVVGYATLWPLFAPALMGNMWNMLHGTSEKDMHRAAEYVDTTYIYGEDDPLAQPDLLHELQTAHPENVHIVALPGKGHCFTLDSEFASRLAANWFKLAA